MSLLDLQDLKIYLSMIFSPVIALQLLDILAARIRYGRYLHKNIHRIPQNFNDTSPIICIQEKGIFPIVSSTILFLVLLLPALTGKTANPTAYKQAMSLIGIIAIFLANFLNLTTYRNCFSILSENSIYINNICTLFRTVRIPIKHITKHEVPIIPGPGFFTFHILTISTNDRQYIVRQITNWKYFIDAIDKLKAKSNSIQAPQDNRTHKPHRRCYTTT